MEAELEVVFADARDGRTLATSAMARSTFLERFDVAADSMAGVFIGGEVWDVVDCEPRTPQELEKCASVRLTMRRQEGGSVPVPARDLRFSMSSLCSDLPPMTGQPMVMAAPYLKLHEDVWRDAEFVTDSAHSAIVHNFREIEAVLSEAKAKSGTAGFGRCFIRTEPAAPLYGVRLSVAELGAALGIDPDEALPLVVSGPAPGNEIPNGLVVGGFALHLGGGTCVYGRNADGLIRELGVHRGEGGLPDAYRISEALSVLMRERAISLVDWRARERLRSAAELAEWLGRG